MEVVALRPDRLAVVYDIVKDHLRITGEEHLIEEALDELRLDLLTTHTHLFYGVKDGRVVSYILLQETEGALGDEIYLRQVHSVERGTLRAVYAVVREYAKAIGAVRVWGHSNTPHKVLMAALTGDSGSPSLHSLDSVLWDDLMSDFRTV